MSVFDDYDNYDQKLKLSEGIEHVRESEMSDTVRLWKSVATRYLVRVIIYSVIIVTLIVVCRTYVKPFIINFVLSVHCRCCRICIIFCRTVYQ